MVLTLLHVESSLGNWATISNQSEIFNRNTASSWSSTWRCAPTIPKSARVSAGFAHALRACDARRLRDLPGSPPTCASRAIFTMCGLVAWAQRRCWGEDLQCQERTRQTSVWRALVWGDGMDGRHIGETLETNGTSIGKKHRAWNFRAEKVRTNICFQGS